MYIKLTVLVIITAIFSCSCGYQTKNNANTRQDMITNWNTIKVEDIVFSIPDNMIKQEVDGRDNLFQKYSSDEISLYFESGVGSETLESLKNSYYIKDLKSKEFTNQGVKGIRLDYQYIDGQTEFADQDKSFAKVVSFDCQQKGHSVTFHILFGHTESNDTAEKIIKSVSLSCS